MADTKISDLPSGTTANSADFIPIARSGSNFYITPAMIQTFALSTSPIAATFTGVTAISGTQLAPALTAGNWTVGSGWESPIVGPGLIKNADGTGTQTPSAATNIVAGTTYKVTITLSAASAGSATYTVGGVAGASTLSAVTTYTDYVTASTTGKLIITPTNTSRFTISAISILAVGDFNGTIGVTKPAPGFFSSLQFGTGSAGFAGLSFGSAASGYGTIWPTAVVASGSNYSFLTNGSNVQVNTTTNGSLNVNGTAILGWTSSAVTYNQALKFTSTVISQTAPTVASGGCTSPTAVTANGTAAFSVGVGTSCSGSQPLVFTLPAATTGWMCTARNSSNGATSAPAQTGAVSTTSVTITNFSRTLGTAAAWTDADNVVVSCMGY